MKDEPIQQTLFNQESTTALQFKDPISSLQRELAQFGFTPNLSKVYIYLGKYGAKTALDVVRNLKIPRTETYNLLNLLMDKGVVCTTLSHPKKYVALPLEQAILNLVSVEKDRVNYLEKSSESLVMLWNRIPDFLGGTDQEKDDKFQILKGAHQIRSRACQIIKKSRQIWIMGPERDVLGFYQSDAFEDLDKTGTKVRLLVSGQALMEEVTKDLKRLQLKESPSDVGDNLCFVVSDSELLFCVRCSKDFPLGEMAFWCDSRPLISSIKMLFNLIWSKS